jgi:hypothetical protein
MPVSRKKKYKYKVEPKNIFRYQTEKNDRELYFSYNIFKGSSSKFLKEIKGSNTIKISNIEKLTSKMLEVFLEYNILPYDDVSRYESLMYPGEKIPESVLLYYRLKN